MLMEKCHESSPEFIYLFTGILQVYAYKEMFNWRDKVARTEDESIAYVLPNHMLLKICTELPREMQGILACCNPVPPLVKQNLNQLHQIVLTARDKPLVGKFVFLSKKQSQLGTF